MDLRDLALTPDFCTYNSALLQFIEIAKHSLEALGRGAPLLGKDGVLAAAQID